MTRLAVQTGAIPLPRPTEASAPFWQGCRRGELLYQRCRRCGAGAFPPALRCRRCLAPELIWERSRGAGALYSWTVVWRPQTPAFEVPYAVAIVDVAEGYQMLSCVVGCDTDDLCTGLALEVIFQPFSDEISLPYFRPVAVPGPDRPGALPAP